MPLVSPVARRPAAIRPDRSREAAERRREAFDHAAHALRLEGFAEQPSGKEAEVVERVIAGEITYDEAVEALIADELEP